mgnify:CR=1 FL=1
MENKNQPRKGKGYTSIVLTIIVIGLLIAGVIGAYSYIASSPTWYVKWKIHSYLRKQTGKRSFKTDFQFPSEKEMKTIPDVLKTNILQASQIGKITKKDIKSLRNEVNRLASSNKVLRAEISNLQTNLDAKKAELTKIQTTTNANPVVISNLNALKLTITNLVSALSSKREQLAAVNKELNTHSKDLQELQQQINTQQQAIQSVLTLSPTNPVVVAQNEFLKKTREKLNGATTYRGMYEVIGQELWVADKLLESLNPVYRKIGLALARQAALDSQNYSENYWLAARIYEAYLLPNLDNATDPNYKMPLSMENILNESVQCFRNIEETDNVINAYKTMIEKTGGSARADSARVQLSFIFEQAGNYKEAIYYLKDIQATNNFARQLARIPALEAKLNPPKKK